MYEIEQIYENFYRRIDADEWEEIFENEIKVLEVPQRVYNEAKEYAVILENCKVLNKIVNDFYE